MKMKTHTLLAALLISLGLNACAPVMMGGFVGGAMVATDRRTSGALVEDEGIEQRGASAMRENFGESNAHVNITSYNRQVLITGEVANERIRAQVEQLVSKLPNVRSIVNELGIGPVSSVSERSNDSLITARVKASMIDSTDVFASVFKVVTERGTVYLMGRVTQKEAARATDLARGVPSVKRVVRVFEYITEDELKAMQPKPPKEEASRPTPVMTGTGTPLMTNSPAPSK